MGTGKGKNIAGRNYGKIRRLRGIEVLMESLRESDLYGPVRDYLEGLGYEVKGEVRDCDITALRDGELIVVELKRGFTLELVYQAMDRQRIDLTGITYP